MWKLEVDVKNYRPQSLSTLLIESGSLSQTQSLQMWLVSLTSLLWRFCLCLLRLELQQGSHAHLEF